jgi:hypothetical protein
MPHVEIKPKLDDLDGLNLSQEDKERIKEVRLEAAGYAQKLALLSDHALVSSEVEVCLLECLQMLKGEMSMGRMLKESKEKGLPVSL